MHGFIVAAKPNASAGTLAQQTHFQHTYMWDMKTPISVWHILKDLYPGIDDHEAIALGMVSLTDVYMDPTTNLPYPAKNQYAIDNYSQNIAAAVGTEHDYRTALKGTPYCH